MDKLNCCVAYCVAEELDDKTGAALEKLRKVCEEKSLLLKTIATNQIYSIYYDRDIEVVFIHTNATESNINLFIEHLMKS